MQHISDIAKAKQEYKQLTKEQIAKQKAQFLKLKQVKVNYSSQRLKLGEVSYVIRLDGLVAIDNQCDNIIVEELETLKSVCQQAHRENKHNIGFKRLYQKICKKIGNTGTDAYEELFNPRVELGNDVYVVHQNGIVTHNKNKNNALHILKAVYDKVKDTDSNNTGTEKLHEAIKIQEAEEITTQASSFITRFKNKNNHQCKILLEMNLEMQNKKRDYTRRNRHIIYDNQ